MASEFIRRHVNVKEIFSYCAGGLIVNGFGFLLFLLLVFLGVGHKKSASMLYVLGVISSYFINRRLVFYSRSSIGVDFPRLIVSLLAGYVINISALYIFVDIYSFSPGVVQFFSVGLIAVYFYLVNKFYVHAAVCR